MDGRLIVIDGVDGAGKDSQVTRLRTELPKQFPNRNFVFTREPGGSPYAEDIRRLILDDSYASYAKDASARTMAYLFAAARSDHLERVVLPHFARGSIIISNRFESSTYAFQIIAQCGGIDARKVFMLQRELFMRDLPSWKTIVLDVDEETAMQRANNREGQQKTHFDERNSAFHSSVRLGFQTYARDFPEAHVSIVDASRTVDEVFGDVLSLIREELKQ